MQKAPAKLVTFPRESVQEMDASVRLSIWATVVGSSNTTLPVIDGG
jgi:hypothetical protein